MTVEKAFDSRGSSTGNGTNAAIQTEAVMRLCHVKVVEEEVSSFMRDSLKLG